MELKDYQASALQNFEGWRDALEQARQQSDIAVAALQAPESTYPTT